MTNCSETSIVNRISLSARDSRDLREKRDWSEVSVSLVAPAAQALLVSLTNHEQRRESQAGC